MLASSSENCFGWVLSEMATEITANKKLFVFTMKNSHTQSFSSLAARHLGSLRLQLPPIAGISILLLWGSSAFGAIQPISNVLLNPEVSTFPSSVVDDDAQLIEFDLGSTGYTVEEILDVTDVTPGKSFNKRFFADKGTVRLPGRTRSVTI